MKNNKYLLQRASLSASQGSTEWQYTTAKSQPGKCERDSSRKYKISIYVWKKQANESVSSDEINRRKLHPRICCEGLHLRWEYRSIGTQEKIPPQSQLIWQRNIEGGISWTYKELVDKSHFILRAASKAAFTPRPKSKYLFYKLYFLNMREALAFRFGIGTPDLYMGPIPES